MNHTFSIAVAVAFFVEGRVSGPLHAGTLSEAAALPLTEAEKESSEWSFSASLSGYSIPDDRDYLSPLLTADHGWLHLEARYNYESLDTASVWLGYNLSFGEKWVFELTPMVGGVFGDSRGIAPGWGLSRGAFEFTTEAEYFFDSDSSEDDYFYAWSELTWSFSDSFWAGIALQRTRAYETELDLQRGILLGVAFHDVSLTGYVFNWGWTDPTFVLAVGWEF